MFARADVGFGEYGQQHFADIGDAILDAALARGDQRIVGDLDAVKLHVMGRGVERMLKRDHPQLRGAERCLGPVRLLLSLVHDFLGLEPFFRQIGGAVVLLLCQQHLTFLLGNVSVGFLDRPLRLADLGL